MDLNQKLGQAIREMNEKTLRESRLALQMRGFKKVVNIDATEDGLTETWAKPVFDSSSLDSWVATLTAQSIDGTKALGIVFDIKLSIEPDTVKTLGMGVVLDCLGHRWKGY